MRSRSAGLLLFALAVLVLVAGLRAVNWLPSIVRKDLMRPYRSIEEARAGSNLGEIFLPAYIPQDLKWPPATVLAQGQPFPALIMEFERIDGKDIVLVISQSGSGALRLDDRIRIDQVKERARYALKGRDAVLEVGVDRTGNPCSRLSWTEGRVKLAVSARSSPFEAIKVAESMLP